MSGLQTSLYISRVPIPKSHRVLLFQTVRGAIDLVSAEVAEALEPACASDEISMYTAEVDALKGRGYLTEEPPEQERKQAHRILGMVARNSRRLAEVIVRFPDGLADCSGHEALLDEGFSMARHLVGDEGLLLTRFEVGFPRVDADVMEHALGAALKHDCAVLPQIAVTGLDALWPWLRSENFHQAVLLIDKSSEPLDASETSRKVISYFEQQVHLSSICKIDGLDAKQMAAVLSMCGLVVAKYPSFKLFLISDCGDGTSDSGLMSVNNREVPFISAENQDVLNMLFRFISSPSLVNYTPFFQPEVASLTIDMVDNQFKYQASPGVVPIEGLDQVRAAVEKKWRNEEGSGGLSETLGQAQCLACKYALVCGRNWIVERAYPTAEQCARSFERRIEQVIPSLLFNLQGNWRPPALNEAHT
jgi:hypothetical protein